MTPLKAAAAWFLLLLVSITNGALREAVIRPRSSELTSHQISCLTGILLILLAVYLVSRKWPFKSPAHAWRTGLVWLLATVSFEFVFGRFVIGHPWSRLFRDYAVWDGRLWIAVLAAILFAPIISRPSPEPAPTAQHKLQ